MESPEEAVKETAEEIHAEAPEAPEILIPNIIATRDKKYLNADGLPHSSITIGGHGKFELPEAETQWKGFYHPEAEKIIACLPDTYKRPEAKG